MSAAGAAAARFLDRYLDPAGCVRRHDQGGDVVSEGQAYGLLLAGLAGRPESRRRIWAWTRSHLQRPDRLLAWRSDAAGHVLDPQPAADADMLVAAALLADPDTAGDGRGLAAAVLDLEAVPAAGALLPVAGPWATGPPAVANPSYWMPAVFRGLADRTGDRRWGGAAAASVRLLRRLTADGSLLPPDWALLADGGIPVPLPSPAGGAPVRYGLDAQRLPLWLAAGRPAERSLAAAWWTGRLCRRGRRGALALGLDGEVLDRRTNPLPLLAAAAAAGAAGDRGAHDRLLARARAQSRRHPTYYGDAWLALAAGLRTGQLPGL